MDDQRPSVVLFGFIDYAVFGFMLLVSVLIGIYFACFAKTRQNTTSEYLFGGKSMSLFPMSMSLVSSFISGITLLGIPAEIYVYGTQYAVVVFSDILMAVALAYVFIPVYYNLQITSTYEYLNMRFNNSIRLVGSTLFLVKNFLYIAVVIYVPALAFSQVTSLNIHLITPLICVICIFYTCVGGLKAVVWTDTLQTVIMLGSVLIVMIVGTVRAGGFLQVLEINNRTTRLELFNFNVDPTIRHTFWTVTIGSFFTATTSCSVNQLMVQRYLAMPTLRDARKTILFLIIGCTFFTTMSIYTGLVVYANFHGCDPVETKQIRKADQILPYFVMNFAASIPGVPGLFINGVFSAALSTMSTGLNAMTGVILQDFIKPIYKKPISEGKASLIMKINVVICGAICVGLVFLVEKLGTVIQVSRSLDSISSGSLLGIFLLGILFPWANAKGALIGGLIGIGFVGWISIGSQAAIANGLVVQPMKPVFVDKCPAEFLNMTTTSSTHFIQEQPEEVFYLYRLSYMYYIVLGTLTTVIVGNVASLLTRDKNAPPVSRKLLSPVIRRFLTTSSSHKSPTSDYFGPQKIILADATITELKPLNKITVD